MIEYYKDIMFGYIPMVIVGALSILLVYMMIADLLMDRSGKIIINDKRIVECSNIRKLYQEPTIQCDDEYFTLIKQNIKIIYNKGM